LNMQIFRIKAFQIWSNILHKVHFTHTVYDIPFSEIPKHQMKLFWAFPY
jgi:hypothetical protein